VRVASPEPGVLRRRGGLLEVEKDNVRTNIAVNLAFGMPMVIGERGKG